MSGSYRSIGAEKQIGGTVTENVSAPDPEPPGPRRGCAGRGSDPVHRPCPARPVGSGHDLAGRGQNWVTSPASQQVTIPARSSRSIPLSVQLPSDPGDHPESVQFSARNGAATSLPVTRTLIPAAGGSFQTLITSSVGRSVGEVSTYNIDVPAGRNALDVTFHTADASADNRFTFYLINPSGTVVTTDATPKIVNGTSVATAELVSTNPVAGVWEIDVVLNLTVNGQEFTQTVFGDVLPDQGPA